MKFKRPEEMGGPFTGKTVPTGKRKARKPEQWKIYGYGTRSI